MVEQVPRHNRFRDVSLVNGQEAVLFTMVLEEYKTALAKKELTSDLVNQVWTHFWTMKAREANLEVPLVIPACDRTQRELTALHRTNRGVVLVPDAICAPDGMSLLVKMFPEIGTNVVRNRMINQSEKGGCIDIEMTLLPPHRNMPASDQEALVIAQGKVPQRLPVYVVGSIWSQYVKGRPFDQGYSSLLAGSSQDNRSIVGSNYVEERPRAHVKKYKRGEIMFGRCQRYSSSEFRGVRSEGRKQG